MLRKYIVKLILKKPISFSSDQPSWEAAVLTYVRFILMKCLNITDDKIFVVYK